MYLLHVGGFAVVPPRFRGRRDFHKTSRDARVFSESRGFLGKPSGSSFNFLMESIQFSVDFPGFSRESMHFLLDFPRFF